jgi:replicative DNA helicase
MTENTENTLSAYLGPEFQQRLIWQLLVEPEFAEKIIANLAIEYFDDPNLRRLFVIMLEYYKEFDKVPNLQNQSIHQAINKYKTPNNIIEEESLFGVIKRISLWNERIINKSMLYDGDVVQKATHDFIKQQEYRKIAEHIQTKVKNGEIKNKYEISTIEDRFQKISHIGEEEDGAKSVGDGLRNALRPEFRQTIPTGIETIDVLTDGGLGKGEIGVVLTPSGVGKTTFLTRVANTAFEQEKNVAQIIFEDTDAQIQRKHSVIWADSSLTRIKDDLDEIERVYQIGKAKCEYLEGKGRLIIKRFSQEDTTMKDIRNWMLSYQKKYGFKFDLLVLDYLDCVESHKRGQDRTEAELTVIKGFETLASDFDIPAWTAIQSNRSGFDAEFVEAHQSGGSIKRVQKAHFFMSVAKTPAQKEAHFANIRIIKARFAQDGQTFEDCVFNNDTMQIIIDDPRYRYSKTYKNLKHHDDGDIDKLEKKAEGLSRMHVAISEKTLLEKVNNDSINDLLRQNKEPEDNSDIRPNTEFKNIETYHISTSRTDLSEDEIKSVLKIVDEAITENEGATEGAVEGANSSGLLELDENEDIEILDEGVSDAVNEGVSDAVNDDLLDFSGDTETHIEPQIDVTQFVSPGISVVERSIVEFSTTVLDTNMEEPPKNEPKSDLTDDEEMARILATDPDAPQEMDKGLQNMLVKKREYQYVKKKE